jgi:hypothetical protein
MPSDGSTAWTRLPKQPAKAFDQMPVPAPTSTIATGGGSGR